MTAVPPHRKGAIVSAPAPARDCGGVVLVLVLVLLLDDPPGTANVQIDRKE